MKRLVAIGGILVVLLAAGWSLFWWLGRDALIGAVDAEVARLEAAGWEVSWSGREIGGFPFDYSIHLTELSVAKPESGFALLLPEATVERDGTEGVLVRLPESFAADLPLPGAVTAEDEQPAVLKTTGEATGLVLRLADAGGPSQTVDIDADMLIWHVRQGDGAPSQSLTFEGLDAGMARAGNETAFRLQTGRYRVDGKLPDGDAETAGMTASYDDVTVTGRTTLASIGAVAEMLYAGAPGQLDLALQAGPAEARLVGGEGEKRATLDWRGGSISAVATLSSGRMDLQGEARQNAWTLTPETPGALIGGAMTAGMMQGTYSMPMAPAPQPDDMAIRLAMLEVGLDPATWKAIDPAEALPRAPGDLVVDLSGTARVTRRIDEMNPGDPPPFEVSDLQVKEVALEALGASAHAHGRVEFLQPIGLPLGTIDVSLAGVAALIDALAKAGVLKPEMAEMADAMLSVYAKPTERGDAWASEITFTEKGPLVNGLPVR